MIPDLYCCICLMLEEHERPVGHDQLTMIDGFILCEPHIEYGNANVPHIRYLKDQRNRNGKVNDLPTGS